MTPTHSVLVRRVATSPSPDSSPVLLDLGCTQTTVPRGLGLDLNLQLAGLVMMRKLNVVLTVSLINSNKSRT